MKITFQAHRGDALISRLIRLPFLSPEYNHISIKVGRTIYEAHIRCGVRKVKHSEWDDSTVVQTATFEVSRKRYDSIKDFLEAQVGKKYDKLGIFHFLWFWSKPKIGKWYCSELSQVALYKIQGVESTEDDYNQRISPYQFVRGVTLVGAEWIEYNPK